MQRHFISLKDLSVPEIKSIIRRSLQIKQHSPTQEHFKNKTLAMLFSKPSTRTRVSAETGWAHYGGHPLFLGAKDLQLGSGEPLWVTAKVISSMSDLILARLGDHSEIEELAKHSSVPVINALTSKYHPLQILADLMTLYETYLPNASDYDELPDLPPLTIAWIGDSNNIVNSMIMSYPRMGLKLRVATPEKYPIAQDIVQFGLETQNVIFTHDPAVAVNSADVIVTDTWVSMGQEDEKADRIKDFEGFQVTETMAQNGGAKDDWTFMHCLPRKEYEVDDQVFNSQRSLVFTEAENRKYTVMAVYEFLLL